MSVHDVRERFSHLPQILSDAEELPPDLLEIFKTRAKIKNNINSIIYIPSQRFLKRFIGSRFVPEQVLFFTDNSVVQILGKYEKQSEVTIKTIKAEDVSYIRMELLLLYGKIDIVKSNNGNIRSNDNGSRLISSEYNTTSFYMIKPGLKNLIKNTWKDRKINCYEKNISADFIMESEEFKRLPFKVKSGMRNYALHPEEHIVKMLFQSEVRRFKIKMIPNTLIAFTDKQLIILEDLLSSSYGWIITYFQKNINMKCDLKRKNSIVSTLDIDFGKNNSGDKIQLRFEEDNAYKFMEYWDAI